MYVISCVCVLNVAGKDLQVCSEHRYRKEQLSFSSLSQSRCMHSHFASEMDPDWGGNDIDLTEILYA